MQDDGKIHSPNVCRAALKPRNEGSHYMSLHLGQQHRHQLQESRQHNFAVDFVYQLWPCVCCCL